MKIESDNVLIYLIVIYCKNYEAYKYFYLTTQPWALVPLGRINRPKRSSSKDDSDFEGKSLETLL